jgi:hypothetical protein
VNDRLHSIAKNSVFNDAVVLVHGQNLILVLPFFGANYSDSVGCQIPQEILNGDSMPLKIKCQQVNIRLSTRWSIEWHLRV